MTADNPAATATADPNASAAPTTAPAVPATNAPTPEGSQATPQEGAPTNEAKTEAGDKPAEQAAPETYTFELPEGMEIDAALADKVTPILRESSVSQEAAQKLASAFAEHLKAMEAGANEAYARMRAEEIRTQTEEWRQQLITDPEIGGPQAEVINARVIAAVGKLATPEFKEAMDKHGWGNHPELVRFINRCIDYVPPETGERAAGGGGTKPSTADLLYGPRS